MDTQNYYRVSVKGLSVDETGRFLLIREADGRWELPGGGLDHDEDPMDGLRREIREETGLEVAEVSKTPIYFITAQRADSDTYAANVIYAIKLKSLDFRPCDECVELRYFSVEEASKLKIFPTVRKFLEVYSPQNHAKQLNG